MNRILTTVIFMFMIATSFGQDISSNEADSLSKLLAVSKKNNDRINILFKLAEYHMFKPGEYAVDLDSAQAFMKQAAILNATLRSADADGFQILLESLLAREKGKTKEGKAMAERAVAMLKHRKNNYYLGRAYLALSDYYNYDNPDESDEKIRLAELADRAFQQAGNIERQAFTLTLLADLYQSNGDKTRAIQKLDTALVLYNSIQYKKLQSVYILYSNIFYLDHLYKQSLNYGLMALKSANSTGDSSITLCQINNRIGIVLTELKEHENAIGYYKAAFKVAEKHSDKQSALSMMINIVQTYIASKKPEKALDFMKAFPEKLRIPKAEADYIYTPLNYLQIYTGLKRFSDAQVYADEILQLFKTFKPDNRNLNNIYHALIKYYLDSRQYASAAIYLRKIDSTSAKQGNIIRTRANYYLRFRLDTALGQYKSAVSNLLEYRKLSDSVFNENSSKQIKQLEIEYETEKQKNEIVVLNQKNQSQQESLVRAKLVRNFIVAGVALLIIIIALLYRQYRLKKESNKVILQKNKEQQHLLTEKEWLVKEIHHRVKNNFHIVASLLEIQSSYLKNKEALSAIKESQNRIHSMSIIHQKLYQSDTLSTIHMPEYIYELVEYLRESYGIRESISFGLQIENIELNHASAMTLGLILNEAITNSIKYAFADTADGRISIKLNHISDSQILLSIADNGRGLPADFKDNISASMGMELLQGLTDDLGGNFSITTNNGTCIKILFNYKTANNTDSIVV